MTGVVATSTRYLRARMHRSDASSSPVTPKAGRGPGGGSGTRVKSMHSSVSIRPIGSALVSSRSKNTAGRLPGTSKLSAYTYGLDDLLPRSTTVRLSSGEPGDTPKELGESTSTVVWHRSPASIGSPMNCSRNSVTVPAVRPSANSRTECVTGSVESRRPECLDPWAARPRSD